MIAITEIVSKIEKAKKDIFENNFDAGTIASILNIAVDEDWIIFEMSDHKKDNYVIGGGYSAGSEDVFIFLSDKIAKINENKDNWSKFKRELRKTLKDELVCNEQNVVYKHQYVGISSMNKDMLRDKPFMKSFASEIACDIKDKELVLEKISKGDSVLLDEYLRYFDRNGSVIKKLLNYAWVYQRLEEDS